MRVVDPGHVYDLDVLDPDDAYESGPLVFVKREGPGYPGNVGHHPGTNLQEVLRALIDRVKYLDGQIHDASNNRTLYSLRVAIYQLEERAARRHGRMLDLRVASSVHGVVGDGIESLPVCGQCGHIGCEGHLAYDESNPWEDDSEAGSMPSNQGKA